MSCRAADAVEWGLKLARCLKRGTTSGEESCRRFSNSRRENVKLFSLFFNAEMAVYRISWNFIVASNLWVEVHVDSWVVQEDQWKSSFVSIRNSILLSFIAHEFNVREETEGRHFLKENVRKFNQTEKKSFTKKCEVQNQYWEEEKKVDFSIQKHSLSHFANFLHLITHRLHSIRRVSEELFSALENQTVVGKTNKKCSGKEQYDLKKS